METSDFLADLLAEARAAIAKSEKLSELKKAAGSGISRNEARAALLKFQIESDEVNWNSVRLVALFTEQACSGCASIHRTFLQFMHEDRHFKSRALRYHRADKPLYHLPRAVMVQRLQTHICADCCLDHGFNINSAELGFTSSFALNASPSYHPEEEIFDAYAEEG